jgi:hypothetical protein
VILHARASALLEVFASSPPCPLLPTVSCVSGASSLRRLSQPPAHVQSVYLPAGPRASASKVPSDQTDGRGGGLLAAAGILADLGSNVKRAVQNNFADVYRQRVIDMMHGQDTAGAKAHTRFAAQVPFGLHGESAAGPVADEGDAWRGSDDGEEIGDWQDEMQELVSSDLEAAPPLVPS